MVRTLAALSALGVSALVWASPAAAEDSLFVRMGVGVGRVRSRTTHAPIVEPSVLDSFAYWGGAFELTLGGRIGRFVVGGTVLEHSVEIDRDFKATVLGGEYTFTLFTVGPSVEFHRDERGGPWCGGTVGLSQFSGGSEQAPFGGAVSVQGGWDFPVQAHSSFGLGARITYARLDAEGRGRQDVFSPMVVLAWARR